MESVYDMIAAPTVTGEADTVFAALRDAFERAAAGHVVMTVMVSNACTIAG